MEKYTNLDKKDHIFQADYAKIVRDNFMTQSSILDKNYQNKN